VQAASEVLTPWTARGGAGRDGCLVHWAVGTCGRGRRRWIPCCGCWSGDSNCVIDPRRSLWVGRLRRGRLQHQASRVYSRGSFACNSYFWVGLCECARSIAATLRSN